MYTCYWLNRLPAFADAVCVCVRCCCSIFRFRQTPEKKNEKKIVARAKQISIAYLILTWKGRYSLEANIDTHKHYCMCVCATVPVYYVERQTEAYTHACETRSLEPERSTERESCAIELRRAWTRQKLKCVIVCFLPVSHSVRENNNCRAQHKVEQKGRKKAWTQQRQSEAKSIYSVFGCVCMRAACVHWTQKRHARGGDSPVFYSLFMLW